MNQTLRWMAAGLALLALWLPALQGAAPLLPPAAWTVAELSGEAMHLDFTASSSPPGQEPKLGWMLRQARAVIESVRGPQASQTALDGALALAVLIPAMAIVAGLCGLTCVALLAWRRQRWLTGVAAVGTAATVYCITASWWLTRAAQAALSRMLQNAQAHLGTGLLGAVPWRGLAAGVGGLRLTPQVGLYLLLLAFLIFLVLAGEETVPG